MPPPKPTILPPAPTTRWHGTITGIGLWLQAVPTARAAPGSPRAVAIAPYVTISPYGILAISPQTARSKAEPARISKGTEKSVSSPAKYASSCWTAGCRADRPGGAPKLTPTTVSPATDTPSAPMGESTTNMPPIVLLGYDKARRPLSGEVAGLP